MSQAVSLNRISKELPFFFKFFLTIYVYSNLRSHIDAHKKIETKEQAINYLKINRKLGTLNKRNLETQISLQLP